jgi:hypothetical protein
VCIVPLLQVEESDICGLWCIGMGDGRSMQRSGRRCISAHEHTMRFSKLLGVGGAAAVGASRMSADGSGKAPNN